VQPRDALGALALVRKNALEAAILDVHLGNGDSYAVADELIQPAFRLCFQPATARLKYAPNTSPGPASPSRLATRTWKPSWSRPFPLPIGRRKIPAQAGGALEPEGRCFLPGQQTYQSSIKRTVLSLSICWMDRLDSTAPCCTTHCAFMRCQSVPKQKPPPRRARAARKCGTVPA
jgi:hypothetical protein